MRQPSHNADSPSSTARSERVRGLTRAGPALILIAPVFLALDGLAVILFRVSSAFMTPELRLLAALCLPALICAYVFVDLIRLRSRRGPFPDTSMAAVLCVFVLLLHPLVGMVGWAFNSTWRHGDHLLFAGDPPIGSTSILVFTRTPYTKPLYRGTTGLPARDIQAMGHDVTETEQRIPVGDGSYYTVR